MRKLLLLSGLIACAGTIWAQNDDPKAMLEEALRQHAAIGQQQRDNSLPHQGKTDEIVPRGLDLRHQRPVKLEMPAPQQANHDMPEQMPEHAPMSHAPQATAGMALLRDSIVNYNGDMTRNSMIEFTYNADGRCSTETGYYVDWLTQEWIASWKYEYEYNAAGQQICYTYSNYSTFEGVWNLSSKRELAYDEHGNPKSEIQSFWIDGAWVLQYKYEYTFDERGYRTDYISYRWEENDWVAQYRYEYTFDEQGRQTSNVYSRWQDGQWIIQNINESTYDEQGRQTYYAYYYWDGYQLVGNYKYEYTYDEQGRQTWYAYYNWDWSTNSWYGDTTWGYTYNEQGNMTAGTRYEWRDGQYVATRKEEYIYDEEGYQLSYTYSYLNENNEWVISDRSKREYTFDENGLRTGYMQYGFLTTYDVWYEDWKYVWSYDAAGNRTSEISYNKREGVWYESSKYDYTYDAAGHMLSQTYSYWDSWMNDWYTYQRYEYTYDEYGYQNSYMRSWWSGSAWYDDYKYVYTYRADGVRIASEYYTYDSASDSLIGNSHWEDLYDEEGRYLGYKTYKWSNGEWVMKYGYEYSYDNADRQTGYARYEDQNTWVNDITLNVKLAGTPLAERMDEEDLLLTGEGFKINTLYVDEFIPAEPGTEVEPTVRVLWENDGSLGDMNWDSSYRFANEWNATGEECHVFTMEEWELIKEGTIRVEIEYNGWASIRVTTGWWSTTYAGMDNILDLVQEDADGTKYLELNIKEDGNLYDYIDEQHLLFTGDSYNIKRICVGESSPSVSADIYWQNDGSLGYTNWDTYYRFSSEEWSTGEEYYTFPMNVWNKLKNETFYVDMECLDDAIIRLTTGWWSTNWTGGDIYIGHEYLQANADGTYTLAVNLSGSEIPDLMDQQHLLFTGLGYRILRIRGEEKQPGTWVRHDLWQNNGSAEFTNWDSTYRFGKEGHEANCIATFGEEDWNLIKTGKLGADIEVIEPRAFALTITSGLGNDTFAERIGYGCPYFSAEIIQVLAGTDKWERTYDEHGNETSYSTYFWSWPTHDWSLREITVYYYSEHESDIQTIVSDVRSRLGKEMRDGEVIIVVGNKAYNLRGELLK